jgi:hypothetical protein
MHNSLVALRARTGSLDEMLSPLPRYESIEIACRLLNEIAKAVPDPQLPLRTRARCAASGLLPQSVCKHAIKHFGVLIGNFDVP